MYEYILLLLLLQPMAVQRYTFITTGGTPINHVRISGHSGKNGCQLSVPPPQKLLNPNFVLDTTNHDFSLNRFDL